MARIARERDEALAEVERLREALTNQTVVSYGREVALRIGPPDEFDQFCVELFVDGKQRFAAHFTNRNDES